VERVRLAYPRKVAAAAARIAIRAAITGLTLGKVTAANGESIPKMTTEDAVSFLQSAAERFGRSPAGMAGKHTPYPSTWFNGERHTEEPTEWEGKTQTESEVIILMPPPMITTSVNMVASAPFRNVPTL
jgi:hypothetical protein